MESPGRDESCVILDLEDESLPSREKKVLFTPLNFHTHYVFNLINNYVRTYKNVFIILEENENYSFGKQFY